MFLRITTWGNQFWNQPGEAGGSGLEKDSIRSDELSAIEASVLPWFLNVFCHIHLANLVSVISHEFCWRLYCSAPLGPAASGRRGFGACRVHCWIQQATSPWATEMRKNATDGKNMEERCHVKLGLRSSLQQRKNRTRRIATSSCIVLESNDSWCCPFDSRPISEETTRYQHIVTVCHWCQVPVPENNTHTNKTKMSQNTCTLPSFQSAKLVLYLVP
jgi:hypothetical protein